MAKFYTFLYFTEKKSLKSMKVLLILPIKLINILLFSFCFSSLSIQNVG